METNLTYWIVLGVEMLFAFLVAIRIPSMWSVQYLVWMLLCAGMGWNTRRLSRFIDRLLDSI